MLRNEWIAARVFEMFFFFFSFKSHEPSWMRQKKSCILLRHSVRLWQKYGTSISICVRVHLLIFYFFFCVIAQAQTIRSFSIPNASLRMNHILNIYRSLDCLYVYSSTICHIVIVPQKEYEMCAPNFYNPSTYKTLFVVLSVIFHCFIVVVSVCVMKLYCKANA